MSITFAAPSLELLSAVHSPDLSSERGSAVLTLEVGDLADDALPTHVVRIECDPRFADPIDRVEVLSALAPVRRRALERFIRSNACADAIRNELDRAAREEREEMLNDLV